MLVVDFFFPFYEVTFCVSSLLNCIFLIWHSECLDMMHTDSGVVIGMGNIIYFRNSCDCSILIFLGYQI